ncbi:ribbon-helix-helix protein, CopG family [Herbiconiux flava]
MRGFRIPTDLYKAAQAKAASEGRSVTDIVREALASYVGDGSATRTSNR